jgi:hypothetical protein
MYFEDEKGSDTFKEPPTSGRVTLASSRVTVNLIIRENKALCHIVTQTLERGKEVAGDPQFAVAEVRMQKNTI